MGYYTNLFWNCAINIDNNNFANILEQLHNRLNGSERQNSNNINFSDLTKNAKSLYPTNYDDNENISNSHFVWKCYNDVLIRV